MRRIGVVTTSRADFGILRPVLEAIEAAPDLDLGLFVTGMHLAADFGLTVGEIEAEGLPILARVPSLGQGDDPAAIAAAMGRTTAGMGEALAGHRPDILVVLGDRFEMFAAAAAAVPFNIGLAHIHGGELTFGAIDEVFRHAITKMSHLHFAATGEYAARIRQMGEEAWRVVVSGAPGLDNLASVEPAGRSDLERRIGMPLDPAPLLVTFHPETRAPGEAERHVAALLDGLARMALPIVFTLPNADAGGRAVIAALGAFAEGRADVRLVDNLGTANYFGLMGLAAAMVGNSSSGIIEAASFRLPVVNVGDRQRGRTRAANVIDAPHEAPAIARAVGRAVAPEFRAGLAGLVNPYGDGRASARIVGALRDAPLGERLLVKRFVDMPVAG